MITNSGLNLIRSRLTGDGDNPVSHGAVGTGTTAEAAGDTTLETEAGTRSAISTQNPSDGSVDMIFTVLSTQGNLGSLTEVGILNALSGGTLLNRITHAATTFDGTFNLKYTIRLTGADV